MITITSDTGLYYYPSCFFCQKVLMVLSSLDLNLPLKNIHANDKSYQVLMDRGGSRQVPCLIVNEFVLYESDDIIEWIELNQDQLREAL